MSAPARQHELRSGVDATGATLAKGGQLPAGLLRLRKLLRQEQMRV